MFFVFLNKLATCTVTCRSIESHFFSFILSSSSSSSS